MEVWFFGLTGFAKDSIPHHKTHTLHDMIRTIYNILNTLKECFLKVPVNVINRHVVSVCGLRDEIKENSVEGEGKGKKN